MRWMAGLYARRMWVRLVQYIVVPLIIPVIYGWMQGLVPGRMWIRVRGDALLIAALLKWHACNIAQGHFQFAHPPFFHPYRWVTFFTENLIGPGVLLGPFCHAPAEVIFTVGLWLAHATSIATVIFLGRMLGLSYPVALVVGVLHGFNYSRVAIAYVHQQIAWDAPWILALALMVRAYRSGRVRYAWIALGALALQFFFNVYWTVYGGLIVGILFLWTWWQRRDQRWRWGCVLAALFWSGMLWWWATPYRRIQQWSGYVPPVRRLYTAAALAWVTPPPGSFWHARLPSDVREWIRAHLVVRAFPGWIFLGLWILGLWQQRSRTVRFATLATGLCLTAMMGPWIRWTDTQTGWINRIYTWAMQVPMLRAIRVPQRWYYLATVPAAIIAGYGLERLRRQCSDPKTRALCMVGLAGGIGVFFLTDARYTPRMVAGSMIESGRADWTRPGDIVLELPMARYDYPQWPNLLDTMIRAIDGRYRTVEGWGAFTPAIPALLRRADVLDRLRLDVLDAIGVHVVIIHCHVYRFVQRGYLCEAQQRVLLSRGFRLVHRDDRHRVLRRPPVPLRVLRDTVDFREFRARAVREGPDRWRVHLRAIRPYAVTYPQRCYWITVQALDSAGRVLTRVTHCARFRRVLVRRYAWTVTLPAETARIRIGAGRRPRYWQYPVWTGM